MIEYVFSDKTGTLTCNLMTFISFYVGYECIGVDENRIKSLQDKMMKTETYEESNLDKTIFDKNDYGKIGVEMMKTDKKLENKINLYDENSNNVVLSFENQIDLNKHFLLNLSLNHECLIDQEASSNEIKYTGPSPDEIVLVEQASKMGYQFSH